MTESYVWDEIGLDRLTDSGQHWCYATVPTVLHTTSLRETTNDGDKRWKKNEVLCKCDWRSGSTPEPVVSARPYLKNYTRIR